MAGGMVGGWLGGMFGWGMHVWLGHGWEPIVGGGMVGGGAWYVGGMVMAVSKSKLSLIIITFNLFRLDKPSAFICCLFMASWQIDSCNQMSTLENKSLYMYSFHRVVLHSG